MADIKSLKQNGVVFYPVTTPTAVIDENGKTVLDLINAVEAGEGTTIAVGGVNVDSIAFTTDPQTQLNTLSNSVANNTSNIALKANTADVYSSTDADLTFATKVDLASKADTSVTTALSTDVLNINSNVTALSNRVTANETELTNISSSITTLDDDVSDINDEITTLKSQVGALEGGLTFESVTTLPAVADAKTNVIYLVPNSSGTKDEYLLVDGAFELIGNTSVDLSGYALTANIPSMIVDGMSGEFDGSTQLSGDIAGTETSANARAYNCTAVGVNSIALANNSAAIGYGAHSKGVYSVALGWRSNSIGEVSLAVGSVTVANKANAIAVGSYANATGESSIQIGMGTNPNENTLQVFDYPMLYANGAIPAERLTLASGGTQVSVNGVEASTLDFDTDPQTQMNDINANVANNTNAIALKQDALVSGTSIKTINGESVLGSGDIVISGGGSGSDISLSGTGANSTAVSGNVSGTAVAANASGDYSVAIGINAIANNSNTIALGYKSAAVGNYAIAIGGSAKAYGDTSTAIGYSTEIYQSERATALGYATDIYKGNYSTALGGGANAYISNYVIAIGYAANIKESDYTEILGSRSQIQNSQYAAIVGYRANIVQSQSAIVLGSTANIQNSERAVAIGYAANIQNSANSAAIGVGVKITNQPNSIVLGNTEATVYQTTATVITSDTKDKIDFQPITNSLEFLNKIEGVRFKRNDRQAYYKYTEETIKIDEDGNEVFVPSELIVDEKGYPVIDTEAWKRGDKKGNRYRIGVKAQDVYKAIKEVYGDDSYSDLICINNYENVKDRVDEDADDIKFNVKYEVFIPHLIEAVKELTSINKALEDRIVELESKIIKE